MLTPERYINPYTDFDFQEERRQYESSLKEYWDYTSTLDTAYMKGERKGREEGRAEGRAEERLANARSLKANGVPMNIIAKSLGLTEDEMMRL